jgi:hypothetical protein
LANLSAEKKEELRKIYESLNPAELKRKIDQRLKQLAQAHQEKIEKRIIEAGKELESKNKNQIKFSQKYPFPSVTFLNDLTISISVTFLNDLTRIHPVMSRTVPYRTCSSAGFTNDFFYFRLKLVFGAFG